MQKLPQFASPFRFPRETAYVALRSLLVAGQRLSPGDSLPADSPLRSQPRRLETLLRTRYLRAVVSAAVCEPVLASVPEFNMADSETETIDLSQMTATQLARACRERGLRSSGNISQLRKRLRAVLG